MFSKLLIVLALILAVPVAGAAADPIADPAKNPALNLADTDPRADNALRAGLYCLDRDGQILAAGIISYAVSELETKIPMQLVINGKLFWTPQGDDKYRSAWKTFKTVTPNQAAKFREDREQPLAYDNTRCRSGLCVHFNGKQKAYACFEDRSALSWRKAFGRLKSYAIDYNASKSRR